MKTYEIWPYSLVLVMFGLLPTAAIAQADKLVGVWLNQDKDGRIEIYERANRYFGKIVWLNEPNEPNGQPKRDEKNPDTSLRNRQLLNLILLKNLHYKGENQWDDGSIYDARNGQTYRCKATLRNPSTLDLRGYVGFSLLGRTTTWTRVSY
ncbi:hypothetical protein BN8_03983 [Fibrisoma limi BUZ 3]|uniref:DUF2147 domain-containing protein n=1 Tax=Fibrisoma limi BUZ 3 TaxID=1185876 RepID=I2GLK3_9BACT|nr:DUF2147 domain-containing protein [Fibrisoma limi]CCH54779.1 hypothetical protein BN8_03983 [Fibrisoma limi BUZ 3]